MPRPDWDTELEFTPEELADMGAELMHRPPRAAQPPAAGGSAAPRRKRVSSLRIPVDAVPRTESGRVVAPMTAPPPVPRAVAVESASDAVVERAFQFTARSFLLSVTKEEEGAGPALEERKFDQTLRGYTVPDSAVPVLAPEAPARPVAVAPPPPPAAPRAPAAPAATDDAIALDDADVIEDQADGAGGTKARPAWPDVDTPPMGSDLAALDAAAARLQPRTRTRRARETAAPEHVEPVETEEISESTPTAEAPEPAPTADVLRGERAFPRVDTVPEAPVEQPPVETRVEAPPVESQPAASPDQSRPADSAVVLAVFDAFGSRPTSILRTGIAEEAQRAEAAPPAPPAPAAPAGAVAPAAAAAEGELTGEEITQVGVAAEAAAAEAAGPAAAAAPAAGAATAQAEAAEPAAAEPPVAEQPDGAPEAAAAAEAPDAPPAAQTVDGARAAEAVPAAATAAGLAARSADVAEAAELAAAAEPAVAERPDEAPVAAAAAEGQGAAAADLEPEITYLPAAAEAATAVAAATVAEERAEELSGADLVEIQEPSSPLPVPPSAPSPVVAREPAPAPPASKPATPEEQGAVELSGADLEEIPDIAADQVAGTPPTLAPATVEEAREPGPAADRMMAAAMVPAPRPTPEEEEELSGADLEEVHEAPTPVAPPTPVAASKASGEAAKAPPPTPVEEPKPVRRRRKRPWFEEVFDEDYLRTLPYLTPEQTKREVGFLEDALGLTRDMHVLDVGCGYGRHAMELTARGYRVTGIDLSLALLIRAADEAQRRGLQVDFVHGDMRELAFDDPFDAAYSVGTSFGFFDDETNRKVVQGLARVVKPGGRLLVEAVNRDYIIGDLPARVWWEGDGCVVLEEVEFNYYTSRLVVRRSVVFEDGRQLEHDISVRVYSLHEMGRILQYAGFRVLDVSGHLSMRGRFFGAASRQILVVAERRSASSGE